MKIRKPTLFIKTMIGSFSKGFRGAKINNQEIKKNKKT